MNKCEEIKSCIACGSDDLELVLDLKSQPLANSFKKDRQEIQEYFPLAINRCKKCFHVQLTHLVHPDLLFKNYLYVSGTAKTQLDYFEWFAHYAAEMYECLNEEKPKCVLDIGCNDGSQLNSFKEIGLSTYGVDPATNLYSISSNNHKVVCNYFNETTFPDLTYFGIIVCQNAFAHNYNPLQFLENVKKVMAKNSLLFITTSQADMILNGEFDTIYHEHLSFYNVKSMKILCARAGLNLIDVAKHPIHGTSYIFVISKSIQRPYNIMNLIYQEDCAGLYDALTYKKYKNLCCNVIHGFKRVVDDFSKKGVTVIGFGAPAKGNTLLNASLANLDFIIDENPLKQGLFTPGTSIPVYGMDWLDVYKDVDRLCFIPLAWNFYDEIKKKIEAKRPGTKDVFVKYFPKIEVTYSQFEELMHHQV